MIEYNQRLNGGLNLIFQLVGSVYPRAAPFAFFSAAVCLVLKAISYFGDWHYFNHVFEHPYVYQIYTFVLGFILVFRCNLSYDRFWEGRTNIQLMSSKWADATLQAVVFDSVSDMSVCEIHKWRTHLVSLMSLLHGVALAELGGLEQQMPIVEGLDKTCTEVLNDPQVQDKVFLVFQWVQDTLVKRMQAKGLAVPPPIATRIFQELSNGMLGFNNALKIHDTPFPFPYVQLITLQLLILTITSGFVINVFVQSPIWACLFSIVCVGGYYAINEVAVELEDPFGLDPNDLPMQQYQRDFNCRLVCCGSLNVGSYRTPRMDPETEKLYDRQTNDVWDKIEGTGRLEFSETLRDVSDQIELRWIGAREVQDLRDLAVHMEETVLASMPTRYGNTAISPKSTVAGAIDDKAEALRLEIDEAHRLEIEERAARKREQKAPRGTLIVECLKAYKLQQVQPVQYEDPYVRLTMLPECDDPAAQGQTLPDQDAGTTPHWDKKLRNKVELACPQDTAIRELGLRIEVVNAKPPKVDMVMGSAEIHIEEFVDQVTKTIRKTVDLVFEEKPVGHIDLRMTFTPL